MAALRDRLAQLLATGGPPLQPLEPGELVIYGAGNSGRAVAETARQRGFNIHSFLDARASEMREVDGAPCHLPTSEAARAAAAAGTPVVVAVFNFAADLRPILQLLRDAGFSRIVTYYEIHEHFGYEPQFWLGERKTYSAYAAEILDGFDLFADEKSQQIYHDHIALRLTFNPEFLSQPDQKHHYVPTDLPMPQTPWRLIDGGAFTGDSIELLLEQGIEMEAIAAFEPDPANFEILRATGERVKDRVADVRLFPQGLSNENAVLTFAAGSGAASAFAAGGETKLEVVAIDDALPEFAPTFIKLDIEGAEPQALAGAARTISEHQPTLAVCVYHAPEHLWTLPALLRSLDPDSRLALRYHQFNGFDIVAYAFPQ